MKKAKPPHARRPRVAAAVGAAPAVSATLIVVWGALVFYLAAYFLTPLPSTPPGLRRGHFWSSLLLGDHVLAGWVDGASFTTALQRLEILAVGAGVLLVAAAAGDLVLRAMRVGRQLNGLERALFATAVGLSLISLATLGLGLCGWLNRVAFLALGAAAIVGYLLATYRLGNRPPSKAAALPESSSKAALPDSALSCHWLWLALPFLLVIVCSAMLPPYEFDVREYHLQVPKEFLQQGRITFVPHNVYANMPLGAEMLALVGMVLVDDWFVGALVGKLLIGCFAPLTALGLLAFGRRFVSPAAGIVAALAYISIPWIVMVSTQGLIDGVLGCYLFLAYYAAWLFHNVRRQDSGSIALAALAGAMAGSAVAVKYTGAVYCLAPLGVYFTFVALTSLRTPNMDRKSAVQALAAFLLLACAACGPWLVKNAVLAGNPVYPLLYDWLGGETRTPELDAQWTAAHRPPNFDLVDLAARATGFALTSYWLSPLVVPLAMLAFLNRAARKLALVTAGYVAYVFTAWWLLTHRIDRFWLPALPLMALLAGMGATWSTTKAWRVTLSVLLIACLAFNFLVLADGNLINNRYLADLDQLRADPAQVEPWHIWLNAHADEVRRVLLVGDAQPFDLVPAATYNTVFDANRFEQLAKGRTSDEIRRELAALGVSHVLVSWREIERYRSPGNYGITDFLQPKVFDDLVADGVLEQVPLGDERDTMYQVVESR